MPYITTRFDDRVVEFLQGGGVGFMPSDTIYGLSCQALNEKAVEKIYKLKGRSYHKPLIVLISNLKMLGSLGVRYNFVITNKKYWPGPVSIIFNAPNAPSWLHRGTASLAVRLPADDKLCDLIDKTGPLVSTSANQEGKQPAESIKQAQEYFGEQLDLYVDGGEIKAEPSIIIQLEGKQLKIIRRGSLKI